MKRYFLKVDPVNDCIGAFGQSDIISRWEDGEISFKTTGPRYANKKSKELAPMVEVGDELWIWTHETLGGQGLVARATAKNVEPGDDMLRIKLSNVAFVTSPISYNKFVKRPNNGHVTGTRLLDYKSISRGTGIYLIEDDEVSNFLKVVERYGGGVSPKVAAAAEVPSALSIGFSWPDEIKKHEDDLLADLTERRLNWQKKRPVQSKFRRELIELYEGKCLLTKCAVPEALEAAHVLPHNGDLGRDSTDNGLLLRRDLHTMFDAMLWSIDSKSNKVHFAKRIVDKSYAVFAGMVIDHQVNLEVLRLHFTAFQEADSKA